MAAPVISVNYEELEKIAQQFANQQQQVQRLTQSLRVTVDQLRQGGWVADGARQYYRSMDQRVFPSLERLSAALGHSQGGILEIMRIFRQAEEEACGKMQAAPSGTFTTFGGLPDSPATDGSAAWIHQQTSTDDGGWNGASLSEAKAIVVNGIQTSPDDFQGFMLGASKALGGVPVMGVYNATAGKETFGGFAWDAAQTAADKFQVNFGVRIGPDNPAVKSLEGAILQSHGEKPIIAHSQGGAITAAALSELSKQHVDLSHVTVVTMGSAEFKFPPEVKVISLVNERDVVPIIVGMQTQYYQYNPITLAKEVISGQFKVDHSSEGYFNQLREQVAGGL